MGFDFTLNGRAVHVAGVPPQTTLLDFLRSQGLTGAKEGCAEGECGACTVLMVKPGGTGSAFVPVNSCLMFAPMAAGQEIYTVEALASGDSLAECQQAMVDQGGSQCGYCTPGFVMSLFAEQYRRGRQGPCDIHALSGNLCRCTGYRPIHDAALSLGAPPADRFTDRMLHAAPAPGAVDYGGFLRPTTLPECLALLAAHPEARMVAGGTDVAVESNLRGRRFEWLISVEALEELRAFRVSDDEIEIGAGLTLSEIDGLWTDAPAVWREWLPLFASPLIRNRATLGGNIATASPIGDGPPLLLALDARVRIAGPVGERTLPLDEFFLDYRKTSLRPGEVLLSVILPSTHPTHARFYKAAKRRLDDISTVAACFAFDIDGRGVVRRARMAYGGVAAVPLRAIEAENSIVGARWNESAVHRAQDILARTLHPISDHRGSAAYRLALAQSLLEKFWWQQQAEAAA
ncbi:Molybdopterin dehydrogenase, FAD-binding [Candidatus Sulfopaludibacter sp. SbA3]|nr:Molybdopterin dehydrogenase, FAD-binding [Candidatus Sulfopaludibacter sp. SbA3]